MFANSPRRFRFDDLRRRRALWPIFALPILILPIGYWASRGPEKNGGLPVDDDAFVSYLQSTIGLAQGLAEFHSSTEYLSSSVYPTSPKNQGTTRATFVEACRELEDLQAAVKAIPHEQLGRLVAQYTDLVRAMTFVCDQLARQRSQMVKIVGEDWDRYEKVLAQSRLLVL